MLIGFSDIATGNGSTHMDRFNQIYRRTWEIVSTSCMLQQLCSICSLHKLWQTVSLQCFHFNGINVSTGYIHAQLHKSFVYSSEHKRNYYYFFFLRI